MSWKHYINQNLYRECQLITALNAYYHLTKKQYCKQGDKVYEDLVDFCNARFGPVTCIEKVYKKLGIKIIAQQNHMFEGDLAKLKLPIEMNIWHKRTGYHSTTIVKYSKQTHTIRVANFEAVTTAEGWMFWEDAYQYNRAVPRGFRFNIFGLRDHKYKMETDIFGTRRSSKPKLLYPADGMKAIKYEKT